MNPRKFKDFHGEHTVTIGHYAQDTNTGRFLAKQFLEVIENPEEYPELTKNDELKKLIKRLPKGDEFNGLIVGFFAGISTRLEQVFIDKPLSGNVISSKALSNYLIETSEYQDEVKGRIHKAIEQWSINFSSAVNGIEYYGLERFSLSDLVFNLPNTLYFLNDCYAEFCFALTLLLKKLMADDGGDYEHC